MPRAETGIQCSSSQNEHSNHIGYNLYISMLLWKQTIVSHAVSGDYSNKQFENSGVNHSKPQNAQAEWDKQLKYVRVHLHVKWLVNRRSFL